MKTVGTHHQVEPSSLPGFEGDVHTGGVLGEGTDRVAETVLDVVTGHAVQDRRQFTPQDFDVLVIVEGGHHGVQPKLGRRSARPFEHEEFGLRPGLTQGGHQAHPRRDLHGGLEQVDSVSAETEPRSRRALHHHREETAATQPIRQHRARDARTGDQHVHARSLLTYRKVSEFTCR